jgi:hypothetical protein
MQNIKDPVGLEKFRQWPKGPIRALKTIIIIIILSLKNTHFAPIEHFPTRIAVLRLDMEASWPYLPAKSNSKPGTDMYLTLDDPTLFRLIFQAFACTIRDPSHKIPSQSR